MPYWVIIRRKFKWRWPTNQYRQDYYDQNGKNYKNLTTNKPNVFCIGMYGNIILVFRLIYEGMVDVLLKSLFTGY